MVLGELHLDGRVEKVTGVLPSVLNARQRGCRACVIPSDNLREGKAVSGVQVFGIKNLRELISDCRERRMEDKVQWQWNRWQEKSRGGYIGSQSRGRVGGQEYE